MRSRVLTASVAVLLSALCLTLTAQSPAPAGAAAGTKPAAQRVVARDGLLPGRKAMVRTIRHMVSMSPRSTGTVGGRRAARYVVQRLRAAGMDKVYVERSTSYSWKASGASLRIGGKPISQTPVQFSFIKGPTGTGVRTLGRKGLTAPVVDLGQRSPSGLAGGALRGKIVMVDLKFLLPLAGLAPFMEYVHDPLHEIFDAKTLFAANPYLTTLSSTIDALQQAGAVGMIGVLADYFDSNRYHNEYYRRSPMTIPGMWVTNKEAGRIRTLLAQGDGTATMRLTTTRRKVVARQPIGIIDGRTSDTIMVQSHHDSLGPGAVEDGTGVSEVLALADYYGRLKKRGVMRDKTLMFTTFDTHFTGYQAHRHFAEKYVQQHRTPYNIVANDTIEHIAKKGVVGPDGGLKILNQSEPRGYFEDLSLAGKAMMMRTIRKHDLHATALLNGQLLQPIGIPTDASFAMLVGVPTISLIAGPIYLYDEADTMRAVDKGQLRPVLAANRDFIDWFEATPSKRIGLIALPPLGV